MDEALDPFLPDLRESKSSSDWSLDPFRNNTGEMGGEELLAHDAELDCLELVGGVGSLRCRNGLVCFCCAGGLGSFRWVGGLGSFFTVSGQDLVGLAGGVCCLLPLGGLGCLLV